MKIADFIYRKLEYFIKKFYLNELIKGSILFVGFGLLYLLFTLLVEYFLWLSPLFRTFLFWIFIVVEVLLVLRFIFFPIFQLLKIRKGIHYEEASVIIGKHFNEVDDKLINFLQLSNSTEQSELLLVSIEQKARKLQFIPFGKAINFKTNIQYLPWAIVPCLFFVVFMVSGNSNVLTQSFDRVINYKQKFLPPAPFEFIIMNNNLNTEQNKDFILQVMIKGTIFPENVMIFMGNESYYLENTDLGSFQFRFVKPIQNIHFYLEANQVYSQDYTLSVIEVPIIAAFEMELFFPKYLDKKSEIIKGTGNAVVPEGTLIKWKIETVATNRMIWYDFVNKIPFLNQNNTFNLSKNIFTNTEYQIFTSNKFVKDYEKLTYKIDVIKDQFPTITINIVPDSLKTERDIFLGQISDDYGLTKLQIIYFQRDKPDLIQRKDIVINKGTFDKFIYSFPEELIVEKGVLYNYYFEVFDNDVVNNFKSSKSELFSYRGNTEKEEEEQNLIEQNQNINSLSQTLKNNYAQLIELDKLGQFGKENKTLEYKDKEKINDFIKRQKDQEEMMKMFSKRIDQNLESFKRDEKDIMKDQLKERLDKVNKEIDENNKLLNELQELSEKLDKQKLFDKVEEFKQRTKNQTKNLQQLVELTRRFYVQKKVDQIKDKLNELGKKQENLSDYSNQNIIDKQQEINKEFDVIKQELKELKKDNNALKKPIAISFDSEKEKSIKGDIEGALDNLRNNNKSDAKSKQKNAAKNMKEMSQKIAQSMNVAGAEQLDEDERMLRQILDNLLAFSFSQEDLMKQFIALKKGSPSYAKDLKKQQDLKQQFKHIDDSLFVLSMRNPPLDEKITKEVGEIYYNIDKALEKLEGVEINKGISYQQYVISSTNILADLLSDILTNMQNSMTQGNSQNGKDREMQLSDIIKKQKGLEGKMEEGMKKGNNKLNETNKDEGDNNEGEAQSLFEIYKEQQLLKEALQKALEKEGLGGIGQKVLDKMEEIEKELLNKGFKNEIFDKIQNLKYELLKLDTAIKEQGEDVRRKARTNTKEYNNTEKYLSPGLEQYLNSIEILNRESLPLRPNYNQKVQQYFRKDD